MPRQFISQVKVPGNEQAYDLKAYQSAGIYYAQVDTTSTSTAFTVTIPELTATEYYDGLTLLLYNGKVTSASGFTINVNGLGAKPSYSNMTLGNPVTPTDPTRETTIFNINYAMLFIYNSTRVSGGCWICYRGYDANTNTVGYQLRTNSYSLTTLDAFRYYKILFTSADNQHWVPAASSTTNSATSKKTPNSRPINPFGEIVYCGNSTSYAANAAVSATACWQEYTLALGYSFNTTGAALTLTSRQPVYVKCTPQANGSAIIDANIPIVQTLPSTADGSIYILLGIAYSATNIELLMNHPIYYYKEGAIRLWTHAESGLPGVSASDNGKLLTVVNGEWAPATKPSYTANEVGALPSNTTYVSSVNGQSGAVTVATPGTLNTTATTAQSTSSSEALSGSISLHKIAKTGTYSDLIGTPNLATVATSGSYTDLSGTPTLGTAASLDITNEYSATGTNPITGTGVAAALATLPTPMQFKGTIGTGGTIQVLPPALPEYTGWTYKVITAISSPSARVGDVVICNGASWVVVPSGDEPSGTVTNVAISNGGGLSVSGSPITSSGTITISHSDTSSQASVSNSGRTYIQSVTLDTYGHVTGLSSATETVTDTNTTYTLNVSGTGDNATKIGLVAGGSGSGTNWYTIPYATSAGTANSVAWANVSGHAAGVKADIGIATSGSTFLRKDGTWVTPTDTNTTYALSGALSSHKFTSTLTAGGSGSGTSTTDLTLAAGSNITLTDDTSNRKITIAATDTNTTYSLAVNGTGDNANKLGLTAGGSGSGTVWVTVPYATTAGSAPSEFVFTDFTVGA